MASFFYSLITNVGLNLMGVLSIYLVTGLCGMFSMGQASFMSIGAYTSGIMAVKWGMPYVPSILLGTVVGAIFGLIIGLPTLKLRRDYVALVTIGFGNAIIALLNNMVTLTGGAVGLARIPKRTNLFIVWISVAVLVFFIWNFKKSKFGRQCMALKSDELAAKGMGINVPKIKLLVFVVSSIVCAYAGALYAFFTTYVEPIVFGVDRTTQWLIMVFFGGVGSLTGSIIASVFLQSLMEILRSVQAMRTVIYCLIVLFIINFRPQGLFGTYEFSITRLAGKIAKITGKSKVSAGGKTDAAVKTNGEK